MRLHSYRYHIVLLEHRLDGYRVHLQCLRDVFL